MANIFILTGPLKGLLASACELARRLTHAGHTVTLATSARDASVPSGVKLIQFDDPAFDAWQADDRQRGWIPRLMGRPRRLQAAAKALAPDAMDAIIEAASPDLLLIDTELHPHVISALGHGRNAALLNTLMSILPADGNMPLGYDMAYTRQNAHLAWRRLRRFRARWTVEAWARDAGADWGSALVHLAKQKGVDQRIDRAQWMLPFGYCDVPILNLHAAEFDFPHADMPQEHYTGPLLRPLGTPLPDTLSATFSDATGPVIYGGFGSFFTLDTGFADKLFEAFRRRPDWTLILTRGGVRTGALPPAPPNVQIVDWVPQRDVLANVDAALVHGGINTIDECIAAEVPMLVYSGGITDMPGNCARIRHHGIGHIGDGPRDTANMIVQRIDALLADADVRTNLSVMRAAFDAYTENRVAERVIEGLL